MQLHTKKINQSLIDFITFNTASSINWLEELFYSSKVRKRPKIIEQNNNGPTELYTPLDEALSEAKRRFADSALREQVRAYLGSEPPAVFESGPRAVLFRNVISPTTELLNVIEMTKRTGVTPLGLEYTADKFSTRNQDKMILAKLSLILGVAKNGDFITKKTSIIDIKANDNRPFREILTLGNESLPHFHHCLLRNYLPEPLELYDMSDWVRENGKKAIEYYKKFFAFFIAHGILFETFITNESESEFATTVVYPAFELVTKEFGIRPLIVKSINESKSLDFWNSYPGDVVKLKYEREN